MKKIISIVIPTRNEEKNIERCLKSILRQKYPRNKIEIIVVDDGSTDRTLEIVKKYPVKIFHHQSHHGEIGKKIGFDASKGDYFIYLDADTELASKYTLGLLAKPLDIDKNIAASFTKESIGKRPNSLAQYYGTDSLQRGPIFSYFSPSIEECIIAEKEYGYLCKYSINKIPPAGRCLYRKNILNKLIGREKEFLELDLLVKHVEKGYTNFAYVPRAVIHHYHVRSLSELIRKRKYNLSNVYIKFYEKKKYKWIDVNTSGGRLKILIWVVFANSIIGPFISSMIKSIKYRTPYGFYDLIIIPLLTDMYIYKVLGNPDFRRKMIGKFVNI